MKLTGRRISNVFSRSRSSLFKHPRRILKLLALQFKILSWYSPGLWAYSNHENWTPRIYWHMSCLFDDHEMMRMQSTSSLKNKLQIGLLLTPNAVIICGCAPFSTFHWLARDCVVDYIHSFTSCITYHLSSNNVYLIFDWFYANMAKNVIRLQRDGTTRHLQLDNSTPIHAQNILLAVPYNKS